MGLTKKQQLFIQEYCADPTCGQREAARRAGFSAKRAHIRACELMRNPTIQLEIERRLGQKISRVETTTPAKLTPEAVIQDLDDIAEMCRQAGPGAWQANTLVKIAELKGKYLKMFTDKIEVGLDDALMEALLEGRKRAGMATPEPAALPPAPTGEGEIVQ